MIDKEESPFGYEAVEPAKDQEHCKQCDFIGHCYKYTDWVGPWPETPCEPEDRKDGENVVYKIKKGRVLEFSEILEGMRVMDSSGSLGVVRSIESEHNVYVMFEDGNDNPHCLVRGCVDEDGYRMYDPLYAAVDYDERDEDKFAGKGCTCSVCGKLYRTDIIVPDTLWENIKPRNGNLLCGSCLLRRVANLREFGAYRLEEV